MPDPSPTPKPHPTITVAEAFQALDRINKSTTWAGMNAREVEDFASMTSDDWTRAAKVFRLRPAVKPTALILIALVGLGLVYLAWPIGWPELALLALAGVVAYRDGRDSGSTDGYERGHRAGVYKALGLTDDEASNMPDWAIRMEVEERTAEALKKPN